MWVAHFSGFDPLELHLLGQRIQFVSRKRNQTRKRMTLLHHHKHEFRKVPDPEFLLEFREGLEQFEQACRFERVSNYNSLSHTCRPILLRHYGFEPHHTRHRRLKLNGAVEGVYLHLAAAPSNEVDILCVCALLYDVLFLIERFGGHLASLLELQEHIVRYSCKDIVFAQTVNERFHLLHQYIHTQCGTCSSNAAARLSIRSLRPWYYWESNCPVFRYLLRMSSLGNSVLLEN